MPTPSNDWNRLERQFEREQLHSAAQKGDFEKVKSLLQQGFDPNAFDDDIAFTPLHYAAQGEQFSIVELLVKSGANINAHDESRIGNTPLREVADTCSYQMAKLLLDLGADPTIQGWMQISALDSAKPRVDEEGRRVYELLSNAATQFKK
jgi:ankyrin repeat protein